MDRRESGFTLLAFMIVLSIMSIMMGVAVQAISFQMRREREAELIFRGEQYIEAIRLYKTKYGRSPMRLKELWEANPKVLRRKWKDPMTDSMRWGLVFEGDLGAQGTPGGRGGVIGQGIRIDGPVPVGGRPVPTGTPGFGSGGSDSRGEARFGDGHEGEIGGAPVFPVSGDGTEGDTGNPTRMGPIIGVHSTSCEESIKEYDARSTYCEWRFIFRDRNQGTSSAGRGGREGGRIGGRGGREGARIGSGGGREGGRIGSGGRRGGPRPTRTVRP